MARTFGKISRESAARQPQAGRRRAGFTLVETMLALIILVILTGIVAMGVPVAFDTYKKAVNGSNAQVLLSTMSTVLRDEMGLSPDVRVKGDVVYYVTEDGYWASLEADPANDATARIVKHVYTGTFDSLPDGELADSPVSIVSDATMTEELGINFEDITYEDGVITVHDLKVWDSQGNMLASTGDEAGDDLVIRASLVKED